MNSLSLLQYADFYVSRKNGVDLVDPGRGNYLLIDNSSGVSIRLNATAAVIWSLCDGTRTVAGLIRRLHQELGEQSLPGSVNQDVLELIHEFKTRQLVEIHEGTDSLRDFVHARNISVSHGLRKGQLQSDSNRVVFYGNIGGPAFRLGAGLIIDALQQRGIDAVSGKHIPLEVVENSTVVIVRFARFGPEQKQNAAEPEDMRGLFEELKHRGNTIVHDVRDYFNVYNKNYPARDLADIIIFPTFSAVQEFLLGGASSSHCVVIYGYCDPRIRDFSDCVTRNDDELRPVFYGRPAVAPRTATDLFESLFPRTGGDIDTHLDYLKGFNLHIDINHRRYQRTVKPLTKVFTAAGCYSNIITERSDRVLEILPGDYPFLIDDEKQLPEMIHYASEVYNTPIWESGLDNMKQIRQEFQINRYVDHFVALIDTTRRSLDI